MKTILLSIVLLCLTSVCEASSYKYKIEKFWISMNVAQFLSNLEDWQLPLVKIKEGQDGITYVYYPVLKTIEVPGNAR